MSDRKPDSMSWNSWIDQQIEASRAQGEFDDLPGRGQPIPDLNNTDEMWWVRSLMAREGVDLLPDTLRLRREVEKALEELPTLINERAVREAFEALNAHIRSVNLGRREGPPSNVKPFDIEAVVERWRAARQAAIDARDAAAATSPGGAPTPSEAERPPWALIAAALGAPLGLAALLYWALG